MHTQKMTIDIALHTSGISNYESTGYCLLPFLPLSPPTTQWSWAIPVARHELDGIPSSATNN